MGCGFGVSNKGKLWKFSGFLGLTSAKFRRRRFKIAV